MDTTHDLEIALRNAMDAHAKWRQRLKTAVATRRSDITPEHAACDGRRDFGKWLHDPHLDRDIRDSAPLSRDPQAARRIPPDRVLGAGKRAERAEAVA